MVFLAVFAGLMPSFLLVGLGGVLRKRLSENAWQGLDRLNFEILFPALLFVPLLHDECGQQVRCSRLQARLSLSVVSAVASRYEEATTN